MRVPCQTLVMMSGIAVMNTTKMVVAFDTPNQMIAKIAQIADDTVFMHRDHRLEELAEAAARAEA